MKRLTRALMALGLLGAAVAALGPAASTAAKNDKITICHRTNSEKNPWVEITISENAWDAHEKHGDFLVQPDDEDEGPLPCPPERHHGGHNG